MTVTNDITGFTQALQEGIYSAYGIEGKKGGVLCMIP